jgi:hypothetical protein
MPQRLNGALGKVIKNSQPAIRRERGKGGKIGKDWSSASVTYSIVGIRIEIYRDLWLADRPR